MSVPLCSKGIVHTNHAKERSKMGCQLARLSSYGGCHDVVELLPTPVASYPPTTLVRVYDGLYEGSGERHDISKAGAVKSRCNCAVPQA